MRRTRTAKVYKESSHDDSDGLLKAQKEHDWDEPALKRQKRDAPHGRPEDHMNWDLIQVLAEKTGVARWACQNIDNLLQSSNTIPFMVRHRKPFINYMDAEGIREVCVVLEELRSVAKKSRSIARTLSQEGKLTSELENALKNCRTERELDNVNAPYSKGSTVSKAQQAKELGLEPAAMTLLQAPQTLNLHSWIQPNKRGLSNLVEVSTGVQEILAHMFSEDKESVTYVQSLCDRESVTIRSSLSRTARHQQASSKFDMYRHFTCTTLAINRGENLKILKVKVNIPSSVKEEFCRWCISVRWKPKRLTQPELMNILTQAAEDSYDKFIMPFLCRGFRTKLTASAEKASVSLFACNLRQRLLMRPVRDRVIMGVDPGFLDGCTVAILSPTSQILHTDVVYLYDSANNERDARKLRRLMLKYSCYTVVIGNGQACRETEAFFARLIKRRFFRPLDVSYCITDEAGASIYSVSPEAVKEMPDLEPNLRSAVCIGRRVQDPLAELIKSDPKHIGIGTYQHDVSESLLKAALDEVVQECVSFVGVDINMCSETLMRHVAGLNAEIARNIMKWREKNGPFLNREQLNLVKGISPEIFQQCAGFIRVHPKISEKRPGGNKKHDVSRKRKAKASGSISNQFNPLDQTCIHPESYSIALRFLSQIGSSLDEVGSDAVRQRIKKEIKRSGLDVLAKSLDTTPETLQLIVDGLTQPPGFDIRQNCGAPDFKRDIKSVGDLHQGMVLTGRVTNAALFGVFVDIGVGHSGLIPNCLIPPHKLPEDRRKRSLALGPGDPVEVEIINVDWWRNRISLDLIRVL